MEEKFNYEESLSLINEMITRAQNNVKKEKAYAIIFLGYVATAAAVATYVLLHTQHNPRLCFWVWSVMIPAAVVSRFIERRLNGEKLIKTHIDKIGGAVWTGYMISVAVFLAVIFTVAFKFEISYRIFLLIVPVILTMVGMGQYATACIYRSKMWYAVAAVFWVGAVVCAFLNVDMQHLLFAVCMILGFVVPGHMMNRQAEKSHV